MTNEDDKKAWTAVRSAGFLVTPPSPFLLLYLKHFPLFATTNYHVLLFLPVFPSTTPKGHIHVLQRAEKTFTYRIKESAEMERGRGDRRMGKRLPHLLFPLAPNGESISSVHCDLSCARWEQDGGFSLISSGMPDEPLLLDTSSVDNTIQATLGIRPVCWD